MLLLKSMPPLLKATKDVRSVMAMEKNPKPRPKVDRAEALPREKIQPRHAIP